MHRRRTATHTLARIRVEEPLMNLAVFLDRPCVLSDDVVDAREEGGRGGGMTEDGLTVGTERDWILFLGLGEKERDVYTRHEM